MSFFSILSIIEKGKHLELGGEDDIRRASTLLLELIAIEIFGDGTSRMERKCFLLW
jgi:hypothetical protein